MLFFARNLGLRYFSVTILRLRTPRHIFSKNYGMRHAPKLRHTAHDTHAPAPQHPPRRHQQGGPSSNIRWICKISSTSSQCLMDSQRLGFGLLHVPVNCQRTCVHKELPYVYHIIEKILTSWILNHHTIIVFLIFLLSLTYGVHFD